MAKQQTLTIVVGDDLEDPADLVVRALWDSGLCVFTQEMVEAHDEIAEPDEGFQEDDSVLILEEV